ncbi:AraC family transcriptional regulator [Flavobacterium sp. CLA17]|uniref:helix-turn-helix domain-containing protein n=1 Tax=Flavobacterium sp. CLA17 TaxID=2724135 RepID=UPI0014925245|nr:AraC family transcriptional regulator [Flavobacterium sp. CLA17]QSB29228.1 helix-turn-helix transcriptional regulator [Flavobacterium sp. CLA17]
MIIDSTLSLINSADKNLAFRIRHFEDDAAFKTLQEQAYSSIIWLKEGSANIKVDFSEFPIKAGSILFLSPFQPFVLEAEEEIKGVCIDFHPEFFCLMKHQKEIAFCGLIFNNIYDPPFITITESEAVLFEVLIVQLINEVQKTALAQHDILVSILKIFMIHASRIKMQQSVAAEIPLSDQEHPFILQNLKDAIDAHFREKHSASEYAEVLKISPKSLSKITKTHLNKTLTNLISERIVLEAKRDLYMTGKSVKEIAYGLGFKDEYHFSRYFRNSTNVSPQIYRDSLRSSKSEVKIAV